MSERSDRPGGARETDAPDDVPREPKGADVPAGTGSVDEPATGAFGGFETMTDEGAGPFGEPEPTQDPTPDNPQVKGT